MASLFDTLDPELIIARRRAEEQKRFQKIPQDQQISTAIGQGLGNFGKALVQESGLFGDLDPELTKAKQQQEILEGLEAEGFDPHSPEDLMGAARMFRDIGDIDQSIKLIDRAGSLQSGAVKAGRETRKFTQEEQQRDLNIQKTTIANTLSTLTQDPKVRKALADAGISEESLLKAQAERLAGPEKPVKVDKDFDVSVDAVISRQLEQNRIGPEDSEAEIVNNKRDQIRSRARDIKNQNPGMSNEAAADQAFDDLLGFEPARFFGQGDFTSKKGVAPVATEKRRLVFPTN